MNNVSVSPWFEQIFLTWQLSIRKSKLAHTGQGSLFVLIIFWCPLSKHEWHRWTNSFSWERMFSSRYGVKGTVGPERPNSTQAHAKLSKKDAPSLGRISLFGVDAPLTAFYINQGANLWVAFHYGVRACHLNEFINIAKINGSKGNRWGRVFLIGGGKMPLIYIVLLGAGDTGSVWTSYSI